MVEGIGSESEFELVKTPIYEVSKDGNVSQRDSSIMFYLKKNGIRVTRDYYDIIELWNDHYVVRDLNISSCHLDGIDEYDRYNKKNELEFIKPQMKFQFGVIKLNRDENGEVIPLAERIVVPIIYDKISENLENSLTAYSNGKQTYIDLDPNSRNYGKQIVPVVLEGARPFNIDYKGFAKCSINGVTGYLPRNYIPTKRLSQYDLFTEKMVQDVLDYLSNDESLKLTDSPKTLKLTRK